MAAAISAAKGEEDEKIQEELNLEFKVMTVVFTLAIDHMHGPALVEGRSKKGEKVSAKPSWIILPKSPCRCWRKRRRRRKERTW